MSSKSDRDNRSNQLNPNNSAYASSRDGASGYDDDDDDVVMSSSRSSVTLRPLTWLSDGRDYALGCVGNLGQVRLIRFRLVVRRLDDVGLRSGDAKHDDFLEYFCENVEGLLRRRWGEVTLRMVFNARAEVIDWLTSRHPLRWEPAQCDVNDPICPAGVLAQPGEVVEARELLARAAASPLEHWGTFDMPPQLSGLHFEYVRRCRALVEGAS